MLGGVLQEVGAGGKEVVVLIGHWVDGCWGNEGIWISRHCPTWPPPVCRAIPTGSEFSNPSACSCEQVGGLHGAHLKGSVGSWASQASAWPWQTQRPPTLMSLML